jgi:DNA polymerase-1
MKLLFDGDMLAHRMSAAVEERSPFNKDIIVKADPEEAWNCIELRIQECERIAWEAFEEDTEVVLCFSSPRNYRKDVNPEYKSNRKGKEKPVVFKEMVERCKRNYDYEEWDGIEADDVMGILQNENTIIVTGDKDLLQIKGHHMNLINPEADLKYVTESEGMKLFYEQCLSGDSVDGFYGCPKIGKKKAKDILEKDGYTWSTVVKTYEAAMSPKTQTVTTDSGAKRIKKLKQYNLGLGEADALLTARCAYILRNEDEYNKDTGEVKLWLNGES